jgi:hypothetical protein
VAGLKPAHVSRHLKISSEFSHFEVENNSFHISKEVHRVRIKPLDDYSESFFQLVKHVLETGVTSRSGIGIVSRPSILGSIHNDSVNHSWNSIAIEEEKPVLIGMSFAVQSSGHLKKSRNYPRATQHFSVLADFSDHETKSIEPVTTLTFALPGGVFKPSYFVLSFASSVGVTGPGPIQKVIARKQ